jgi:Tfp pilus tip-associated adhesin PilY1
MRSRNGIGQYRKRFGALGDLSNAQPVVVFAPSRPYSDNDGSGSSAYKTALRRPLSARDRGGQHDGMVHMFDTVPMPQGGVKVTAGGGARSSHSSRARSSRVRAIPRASRR